MIINPKLHELFAGLTPVIALDLETTGLRGWADDIDLIAIKTQKQTYVLEASKYKTENLVVLFENIGRQNVVIAHNAKFDVGFIYSHYGVLLTNCHCTKMGAEMCENGLATKLRLTYDRPFSLVSVLARWLGVTHANEETKSIWQKSFVDKTKGELYRNIPSVRLKQMQYAVEDVEHLHALYEAQMEQIKALGLETIYRLEYKLLPVLVKMEQTGCLIDKDGWMKVINENWKPEEKEIIARLDAEAKRLLGKRDFKYSLSRVSSTVTQFDLFGAPSSVELEEANAFNYGSQDHLFDFFRAIKAPIPRDKHDKESLEEECLLVYLTEHPDSKVATFLTLLLEHRKVSKLISTYGELFLSKLDDKNYIHTEYTQTEVETGRNSSKRPNLQNIPKAPKDKPSRDIRRFFIAKPDHKFVTCDMSGAEVAIAADYSQEPILLAALREGADMHSQLASVSFSLIFNRPIVISKSEEPFEIDGHEYTPSELRDVHKSVVFAKFYKGGAARVYGVLSKYINRHCDAKARMGLAKKISDALDEKMPKLSEYLSSLIVKAQKDGFLRTSSFGRIRYFDSSVYGEAANAPIQGTNAEAIKMAMVRLDKLFSGMGHARIVMVIHDELVCEVHKDVADEYAKIIKDEMAAALSYFLTTIKGGASVKISDHWQK